VGRKLKHTERQQLAASVLEFIEWELEPTEQQKLIKSLLGDLDNRMGRKRGPKILVTVEVTRLRGAAMETLKNQIIAHTSGVCAGNGSVKTSFKRLEQSSGLGFQRSPNY
jgi:hypothetical protein